MRIGWGPADREGWELFHKHYGGGLEQSWAYGQALAGPRGVAVHRATVTVDGQLAGIAQFMARRVAGYLAVATCTRGPVWHPALPADARTRAWRELRRTVPTRPLRVTLASPDQPEGDDAAQAIFGRWRVMTGHATVMLDLTRPLEELRAALDGKWRNRLARAEADAAFACRVEASLPECRRLLEREAEQREKRRFFGLPTDFVPAYIEASGSREASFVVSHAQARKATIAAMLFLVHGSGATYHVGWADEAGRKANAHNLLLWRGIEHLKKLGVQRLDLGGVNTRQLPGISRFKLGTGGQVLRLAGTFF